MASEQNENLATDATTPEVTIESAVEHAKRAFALKKYEQAVDHYATALELMTNKFGENSPYTADLYFAYGKALLENAISQNSVLGKEQPEDGLEDEDKVTTETSITGNAPILSFSGDAEDVGNDDSLEPSVDLFGQASQTIAKADATGNGDDEGDDDDEGDEAEPEDDFNAAWEVLDLARAIYEKQIDEEDDEEVKLKLADTFITLGDVSLETEKFDQAITDYEAGLALKVELLPLSSRQIAEAHYKLSMVLDLTSGRLADAIVHAEKALESVEHRLSELQQGLRGDFNQDVPEPKKDIKSENKWTGARLARDDLVHTMTSHQIEGEIKELSGLKEDLALKVEELKTTPSEAIGTSAPALVAQALDKELNGGPSSQASAQTSINDLTSMVVKKKKKLPEDSKRKADTDAETPNSEKKVKLDT